MTNHNNDPAAWIYAANDEIYHALHDPAEVENKLLLVKQQAAQQAITVAHATGSHEPDRAIRSLVAAACPDTAPPDPTNASNIAATRGAVTLSRLLMQARPPRTRRRVLAATVTATAAIATTIAVAIIAIATPGMRTTDTLTTAAAAMSAGSATAAALSLALTRWYTTRQQQRHREQLTTCTDKPWRKVYFAGSFLHHTLTHPCIQQSPIPIKNTGDPATEHTHKPDAQNQRGEGRGGDEDEQPLLPPPHRGRKLTVKNTYLHRTRTRRAPQRPPRTTRKGRTPNQP
jgi:hypothetical protein